MPGRIVFVNRFYRPDISATSQMLTDLAEALAREGYRVTVLCSRQLYENPGARLPRQQALAGVTVWRIGGTRFGRQNLLTRAVDYASFYLGAALLLLSRLERGDVLVVKTDPPLLSVIGAVVARLRRVRLINWLQDIYPEIAGRLGLELHPRLLTLLCGLRNWSLRGADNVVLGTRMREHLLACGVDPASIHIGENWASTADIEPMEPGSSRLRRRLEYGNEIVVAYSGNLGRAHDAQTLLGAIGQLREDPGIRFLMIGGGAGMSWLRQETDRLGLTNIRFEPYQPRASLGDSLAAGDLHLVTLVPALEGLIVPSKLYGILAAARPVIFVGDALGEPATLIAAWGVGAAVQSGESGRLAAVLREWASDPDLRERAGRDARQLFLERFTLDAALARWRPWLDRDRSRPGSRASVGHVGAETRVE